MPGRDAFERLADRVHEQMGRSWAFHLLFWGSLGWFALGPFVGWAEWWYEGYQVVTQWVSFQLIFALQNAGNRVERAAHIKLDELVAAVPGADRSLLRLDEDDEAAIAAAARRQVERLAGGIQPKEDPMQETYVLVRRLPDDIRIAELEPALNRFVRDIEADSLVLVGPVALAGVGVAIMLATVRKGLIPPLTEHGPRPHYTLLPGDALAGGAPAADTDDDPTSRGA